jgi:hypothetical protein
MLQSSHEVYQFLSGTPITPSTKFLSLKNRETLSDYKRLVGFVSYVKLVANYRNSTLSEHSGGLRRLVSVTLFLVFLYSQRK